MIAGSILGIAVDSLDEEDAVASVKRGSDVGSPQYPSEVK